MRLVLQVGGAEMEVDVSAASGATVGELADALAGGPVAPATGLVVGARFLAPQLALSACGLRQGDVIRLAPGVGSADVSAAAVAELHIVGGLAAGARFPLGIGSVVIGRHGDVALEAATLSARHARLDVDSVGNCVITDLGSCNGTHIDGRFAIGPELLPPGALLRFGAVQARVVPAPSADRAALGSPGAGSGTAPFNRPPRRMAPAGPVPVAIPVAPVEPAPGARFSWAMLLAPLAIGGVMAVVFSPIMAAFALFSPVMAVGTWWEDRRRVRRERERNSLQVAADLAAFGAGLAAAAITESQRRAQVLPDPAEVLRRTDGPSTRLWERRRHAPDLLRLRLGLADVPWQPPLAESHGSRPLAGAEAVLAAASMLPRTPVEVDLGPGRALGVVGDRAAVVAVLRSLVCQAAVHHGPADVQVAVFADEQAAPDWEWAKWLPHAAGLCAIGREESEALAAAWPRGGSAVLLAVVDGDGFTEGRVAPVRDLLAGGSVAAIVVVSTADRLPALCTTVVEFQGAEGVARVSEPAIASVIDDVLVAGVGEADARRCGRALAALDDPEAGDGSGSLPDTVPLLGLLGLGEPTAAGLAARWKAARPGSLAAVIGTGQDGPLVLDLVADGPHALVAGTTGAGKSELLRTLVASLTATHGPDRLTLVLIDYKGGSAFAECARLPHVVGVVTDLDEQLGGRALRSLEAELRHRETLLARAGAADLDEHDALARAVRGPDPIPRLLVLVDEFATMAAELPDFVDSLVGIAQRGRSLGVHLVLATQRPSGAVSDCIRANTNLRIALRVQDVPDSTDIIGTPQAAVLDRRRAGRGFVRLGHAEVVGFQAALVSTVSPPDTSWSVRVRPFGFVHADADADADAGDGDGDGVTDLVRLVDAARAAFAAGRGNLPRRPWLDPLPETLDLTQLPPGSVGLADEPEAQRQVPYRWAPAGGNLLLYGIAGSGTTTTLASIALSLVWAGGRPVHLYVLDFGNGALAPLAGLPEVGGVVAAAERERQERLLRTLRSELERRRRDVASGQPACWPDLVLLVDNLGGFCAAFDDVSGMQVRDDMLRLLADGPTLGMATVASADRPGAVPVGMSAVVQDRLVFRLADPYDDTIFGLPAAGGRRGPGRAVDAASRREVQVALPAPGGLAGLAAVVKEAASGPRRGAAPPPPPVAVLPAAVALHDIAAAAHLDGPEWFIPVGIGDAALAPVGLRLGEGDHALVAGPSRSGKSTVLCTIAAVVGAARLEVGIWAVTVRRSPLSDAPAVTTLVSDQALLADMLADVLAAPGPQLVLVDDADTLDDPAGAFVALFAARRPDVHVVAAGRADAIRATYGNWVGQVRRSRQGIALRPHLDLDGDLWHTVLPRRGPDRFEAGRGYLVCEGSIELVQTAAVALPVPATHDPQGPRR